VAYVPRVLIVQVDQHAAEVAGGFPLPRVSAARPVQSPDRTGLPQPRPPTAARQRARERKAPRASRRPPSATPSPGRFPVRSRPTAARAADPSPPGPSCPPRRRPCA
jgi:hypothetical protein